MSKWDEYGWSQTGDPDTGCYQRSGDDDIGINRKGFKGKYLDDIIGGIKSKYAELYPGKEIQVRYDKEGQTNYFEVYVEGPAFHFKAPYNQRKVFLYIDKYSNASAVAIFATLPREEFYEKYDDYSTDNIAWLNEQLEHLKTAYALRGVSLYKVEMSDSNWNVEWILSSKMPADYSPRNTYVSGHKYLWGSFDKYPISTGTAKSVLRKIKSSIEDYIKNPNKY